MLDLEELRDLLWYARPRSSRSSTHSSTHSSAPSTSHSESSTIHPTLPHGQLSVALSSNVVALLAALHHLTRIHFPANDWEALQDYHNLCKDLTPLFTDLEHVNEFVGLQLDAHFTNEATETAEHDSDTAYDLNLTYVHATGATGPRADARVRQGPENEDGYIVVDVLAQPRGDPPSYSRWWHFR